MSLLTAPSLQYFILLLIIFLLEIVAGILAYVYYQQVRRGQAPRTCTHTGTHTQGEHTQTPPSPAPELTTVPSGWSWGLAAG